MIETWRGVAGTAGFYEASNFGRMRSWVGRGRSKRTVKTGPTILIMRIKNGYNTVTFAKEPTLRQQCHTVHTVVLEAFHGARPVGNHGAHLNGNRLDNRECNLKWVTPSENEAHKVIHGTKAIGERAGNSKLLSDDVIKIRLLRRMYGYPYRRIAKLYGINMSTAHRICTRQIWRHI